MQDGRSEVAYQAVIFSPESSFREKFIGGYGQEHKPSFVRVGRPGRSCSDSGNDLHEVTF